MLSVLFRVLVQESEKFEESRGILFKDNRNGQRERRGVAWTGGRTASVR